jgi:8-oxo-dGTP pyrophosphatase MutT (NUDIX family)
MDVPGGREDSAVLVPMFSDAEGAPHAVFTERRHDLRRHAGEISFPGGRRDGGESLRRTALREAWEEIGLPPDRVRIVGALAPVGTYVTNYKIYPFVGVIEAGLEWVIAEAEVAQVLELSIASLVAGAGERRMVRRGMAFRTHTYEVGEHLIWGATARILFDLLERLQAE